MSEVVLKVSVDQLNSIFKNKRETSTASILMTNAKFVLLLREQITVIVVSLA